MEDPTSSEEEHGARVSSVLPSNSSNSALSSARATPEPSANPPTSPTAKPRRTHASVERVPGAYAALNDAAPSAFSKALSGSKAHGKAIRRAMMVERRRVLEEPGAELEKKASASVWSSPPERNHASTNSLRSVVADALRSSGDASSVFAAAQILLQSLEESVGAKNERVAEYCLWALYDLARKDPANRPILVDAEALPGVVRAMTSFARSAPLQQLGCSFFWILALDEATREKCVRSGACAASASALRNHSSVEAVVVSALGAIKPVSVVDLGRKDLETASAREAVAEVMARNASNPWIQSQGCSVLSNLAVDLASRSVADAGPSELRAVLGAMMEHPTEASVQKAACFVLKNLTFSERNLDALARIDLPVEELIHHAPRNAPECRDAAQLLSGRLRRVRSDLALRAGGQGPTVSESETLPERASQERNSDNDLPDVGDEQKLALAEEIQRNAILSGDRGEFESALSQLEVSLKMKRSVYGEGAANADLVHILNCMGYLSALRGYHPAAALRYEESLSMQRLMGADPSSLASTMTDVATMLVKIGDLDRAESYLLAVLDAKRRPDGSLGPDAAKDVENLADLYRRKGDVDKAENFYVHAVQFYRSSSLPGTERVAANVVSKLAHMAGASGKLDLAESRFEMALVLKREIYKGNPSSDLVDALNCLGYARALNGNDLDAAKTYEESAEMQRQILGSSPDDDVADEGLANTYTSLGVLYLKLGDPVAARDSLESALVIKRDLHHGQDDDISSDHAASFYSLLTNLGEACALEDDFVSAESYYRDALGFASRTSPADVATLFSVLGNLASERGDYESAREYFARALETANIISSPNGTVATTDVVAGGGVDFSGILDRLGHACCALRSYAAAIDNYELCLELQSRTKSYHGDDGGCARADAREYAGTADTLHGLGIAHRETGNLHAARRRLAEALAVKRRLHVEERDGGGDCDGDGVPRTAEGGVSIAETIIALADVHKRGGEFDEAEARYEEALSTLESVPGALTDSILSELAAVRTELGNLAGRRGDTAAARDHLREAVELRRGLRASTDSHSPELVDALNRLGFACAVGGEDREALASYEESLEMQRSAKGDVDETCDEHLANTIRTVEILRAKCGVESNE